MFLQVRELQILDLLIAEHELIFFVFSGLCQFQFTDFLLISRTVKHWVYEGLELDNQLCEKVVDARCLLGHYFTLLKGESIILFHAT